MSLALPDNRKTACRGTNRGGRSVVKLGIAVNRKWKNQQGKQQEETTFIDCEAWGRTAEVINEHLRKGRSIFIEGRLKLDQWRDKEGNNLSKLQVTVESFQFMDSPPERPPNPEIVPGVHVPIKDDEIPF